MSTGRKNASTKNKPLPWVETTIFYTFVIIYPGMSLCICMDPLGYADSSINNTCLSLPCYECCKASPATNHSLARLCWILSITSTKAGANIVVWIPSEEVISMWKKIWPLPDIWKDCVLWLQLMDIMTIIFYAALYRNLTSKSEWWFDESLACPSHSEGQLD